LVKGVAGQKEVAPLHEAARFFAGVPEEQVCLCHSPELTLQRAVAFRDSSSLSNNPGWALRNILYYLNTRHGISKIEIICLRNGDASRSGTVSVPAGQASQERPASVGWERNKAGKLGSRTADLGPMMDPARYVLLRNTMLTLRLADQAVDLNLKLMRWRIMPSLDLETISSTKCLLLGAGTLGCYVSRALMVSSIS
jgi:ubiquitin-like modifier-activating enzyme ATG7